MDLLEKENGAGLTSPVSKSSIFTCSEESASLSQILPCKMNEMTSEYRVSDSTNANPMIIGTKSWLVLLGLRPIDSIAEAASFP
jgi:hypothetical protein